MLIVIILLVAGIIGIIIINLCNHKLHVKLMTWAVKTMSSKYFCRSRDIIDEYQKLCIRYGVDPVDNPHELLLKVLTDVRRRDSISKQKQNKTGH